MFISDGEIATHTGTIIFDSDRGKLAATNTSTSPALNGRSSNPVAISIEGGAFGLRPANPVQTTANFGVK